MNEFWHFELLSDTPSPGRARGGGNAPRIPPDPYDGVNRGGGGGMCVFRWMWIFIWLILECSFCLIVLLIC